MWTGAPIWQEIRLRFALSLQVRSWPRRWRWCWPFPRRGGRAQAGQLDRLHGADLLDRGLATPSFWLGIVFILLLLVVFHWLPPMIYTPFWVDPWENLKQLIWPALAVGYRYSAVATRMTRSAMLECSGRTTSAPRAPRASCSA